MFGGPLECPKVPLPRTKPKLEETDIFIPHGTNVSVYGHRGRDPNTDYEKRLLHFKQREIELQDKKNAEELFEHENNMCKIIHQTAAEKKRFRLKIQERLKVKLAQYEVEVEKRRDRLRDLLGKEEREFIKETVDRQQNADANMLQDKKNRCEQLRATKEAERLEIVKKKRFQQYAARSLDLRPFLTQKNLMESKASQLQQIRENEMRREMERELDKMWADVARRQEEAFLERETHQALVKYERQKRDKEVLDKQVKAKKLMEAERKQIELLNKEEMLRSCERIKQAEQNDLIRKHQKREEMVEDLKQQLLTQQEFEAKRKREEHALDQGFKLLADLEWQREQSKVVDDRDRLKRESVVYREHIRQLQEQRKEEEKRYEEVLLGHRLENQRIQTEKKCKEEDAKRKLQESVLEGRAKQVQDHRERAEMELKLKEEENEYTRSILEKNLQLEQETKRLEMMATKQYRADLKKQIEYNNLLREREIKTLEEQLRQGMEEEESFRAMVTQLMTAEKVKVIQGKHPFRMVLEQYDCHCPEESK